MGYRKLDVDVVILKKCLIDEFKFGLGLRDIILSVVGLKGSKKKKV